MIKFLCFIFSTFLGSKSLKMSMGELNAILHAHNVRTLNSFIKQQIFDPSKLKALADDKVYWTEKFKLLLRRAENIVGKGGNAVYQHFLLFSQLFQKSSHSGYFKVGYCLVKS